MSESNCICLSQIWVKKETKKARIYDISHFTTKVRRCSESILICLSQIWVKKETKKARIYDISHFATQVRRCSRAKSHLSESNLHVYYKLYYVAVLCWLSETGRRHVIQYCVWCPVVCCWLYRVSTASTRVWYSVIERDDSTISVH